jgi:hypothetical protein
VKHHLVTLALTLISCSATLPGQQAATSLSLFPSTARSNASDGSYESRPAPSVAAPTFAPFSRFAFGGGISPLGVQMQAATSLNRHMNARVTGNLLNLNVNNINTNGFNVDAQLNMASAGASLDVYPFPAHGLRLSPGLLFYNTNAASGLFTAQGGTSFTLNGVTYYSSSSNPVQGNGTLNLHKQSPALTLTTGWGNMIPRSGGHFSFPVEVGVAFIGSPDVAVNLQGQACDATGLNCVDVATDPTVQANLASQVAKYKNDLNPLKTYPIFSFGAAYSFGFHTSAAR